MSVSVVAESEVRIKSGERMTWHCSWFYDYNMTSNSRSTLYSMAGTFPLWQNITPPEIANNETAALAVASGLRYILGRYSGSPSVTTLLFTGLQWVSAFGESKNVGLRSSVRTSPMRKPSPVKYIALTDFLTHSWPPHACESASTPSLNQHRHAPQTPRSKPSKRL